MAYYITYSISLIVCWGLLLLDLNKPGLFGVFVGLIYTYYSPFMIRHFVEEETRKLAIAKFAAPVFYVSFFAYAQGFNLASIIDPINIAFIIFCVAAFSKELFPKKEVQFFVIAFIYLYSFSGYNMWESYNRQKQKSYDFELQETKTKGRSIAQKIPNLSHYQFLNSDLDTIKLGANSQYVIIETWNEKCPPCFKAIKEMGDFYQKTAAKAEQYYVYIPTKKTQQLDYTKIFSFDKIKEKSQILVDVNLQDDALLNEYPVFLVFDKKGELVFSQIGYRSDNRAKLEEGILGVLK